MARDSLQRHDGSPCAHLILYVADQTRSTRFYRGMLGVPRLNVPGMTEFTLPGGAVLGLMPEAGIRKLLGPALPDPATARGVPHVEIYLLVTNSAELHQRALASGAVELSPLLLRDWGHRVAYSLDLDFHLLAFASASERA